MDLRPSQLAQFFVMFGLLLAASFSAAQSSQAPASPQQDSPKAAPAQTQPQDKSLVDGAQEQIKKLHDYMHPPEPVKDLGDPNVKVWADLRTALYYCPGSKQYGHTSKGKYLSQKDAEDSNFQSALRVPCPAQPVAETKKPAKKSSKTASKKSTAAPDSNSKQQN